MHSGHIFLAASGFGKRVIPKTAPFTMVVDSGQTLLVRSGDRVAAIQPDARVNDSDSGAATSVDIAPGPSWNAWWLETSAYRLPMPEGWTAHASGSAHPAVFDLVGPHQSMISVQAPRRVPPFHEMVARGQELVDRGSYDAAEWITVRYTHEGEVYVQRHAVVRFEALVAVVSLQCLQSTLEITAPTHEFVVNSMRPAGTSD